jgi:hypothetical protein
MTLADHPAVATARPGSRSGSGPESGPGTSTGAEHGRWPRLRTAAPVLVAVVVSGALHLAWWRLLASSGGDIAAQDAWAHFARAHPGSAYDLAWYGGMHPASYSLLSPYLMAVLGVRATMVVVGAASAGLLAWLVTKRDPKAAHRWWPALYGACALVGDAVSGRVTFALGTCFALASLCIVFVWPRSWGAGRRWVRGGLTVAASTLATAASPVAGLFLGLVAASLWLTGRRPAAYTLGLPPTVVVGLSALLFPFSGEQPMAWDSTILPLASGAAVALLSPRTWRSLRVGASVYVVAVLLAWLVPSQVGTNISRLGLLFGGSALVAVAARGGIETSLAARRLGAHTARVVLVLALVTCTVWQIATAAHDAVVARPSGSQSADLSPLIDQLDSRDADLGRVEVVPTRSHREAAALAPYANLARGWNRQADAGHNPIFYRTDPLTPRTYRRWLHRWAVGFVVLPAAELDPAAVDEGRLVTGGVPYLTTVWADANWTLLEVHHATPLVSPPAKLLRFDAVGVVVSIPRASTIIIRVAYSPWLSLLDQSGEPLDPRSSDAPDASTTRAGGEPCLSDLDSEDPDGNGHPHAEDWTVLHAPRAGVYRLAAPYKLPRGTACP